jgi:hypothetical protein
MCKTTVSCFVVVLNMYTQFRCFMFCIPTVSCFNLVSEIKEHAYRVTYEVLAAVTWRLTAFSDVTLSISVLKFQNSRLYLVGKESTGIRNDKSDLGPPKN